METKETLEKNKEYKCPQCETVVSKDDTVCPECGVEFWECNCCGAPILENIITCPECGQNLEGEVEKDEEQPEVDPKLVGIGGWLILTAIGFVLGTIIGVVGLIIALSLFSDVADAGYGGLYALELLVDLGLLAFMIYVATRFFGKKSNAPSTIIALLIASVVTSGLLLLIELGAGAEVFAIESGKHLVQSIISAAIWIPYFRKSKRVKATFVN